MKEIRIAIAGVGNCASSLIQGIEYYRKSKAGGGDSPGLMHYSVGGYRPADIRVVAAFDIDRRKVGRPLNEAILSRPNCTKTFQGISRRMPVKVAMGNPLDGVSEHFNGYADDRRFIKLSLEEMLGRADYVVCLAIANEETENLMNAAAFARIDRKSVV